MTKPSFRIPHLFMDRSDLIAVESTRHGGFSQFPYHSLNLGLNTKDAPEIINKNRTYFFELLGIDPVRVVSSFQCHGIKILNCETSGIYKDYDALITNQPNLFLTITIADCTPILIYHPPSGAIGAAHAGWRGTAGAIGPKVIRELSSQYGAPPKDCLVYIGTCIDGDHYEVGEEVAKYFPASSKKWNNQKQKFFVDLKKANCLQLLEAGIPMSNIEISTYSTFIHNDDYFSYRKENGQTGRMLALIGLKNR